VGLRPVIAGGALTGLSKGALWDWLVVNVCKLKTVLARSGAAAVTEGSDGGTSTMAEGGSITVALAVPTEVAASQLAQSAMPQIARTRALAWC
jgi:hypothetical protein